MGEPEVFKAYQKMWNKAADVIVPMVREIQIKNGVEPYTPEQYADYGNGTGEDFQAPEEAADSGTGREDTASAPEESEEREAGTEVQEP